MIEGILLYRFLNRILSIWGLMSMDIDTLPMD